VLCLAAVNRTALAIVVLLATCAALPSSGCTRQPPSPPAPAAPAAPPAPSFRTAVEPVLARTCAGEESCHGAKPTRAVPLDLRAGKAYASMVGVASKRRPDLKLVAPGTPARSFLIDKLTGNLGRNEGRRMPLDPDTGVEPDDDPLPPGFVKRVLVPWIAAGARDD
jgi:hypothetical protein